MLNIPELEKRWLRYKIKIFLPYIIIFLLVLIVPTIVLIYKNQINIPKATINTLLPHTKIYTAKKEINIAKTRVLSIEQNLTIAQPIKKSIVQPAVDNYSTKTTTLKPSMDFIQALDKPIVLPKPQKKIKKIKKVKQSKRIIKAKPIVHPDTNVNNGIKITIERKESQKDIQDVIRRFQNNKNPALSLFVAKRYYERGDYTKAYNYALLTNQIDHNIDASWILFAKALVKLNKKDEAIKTLVEYINYSHSSHAKILLNEIRTGKFR
jgi:tetratricopeptide (TPR) repeat protein